jgi:signal transduction histidine kinase
MYEEKIIWSAVIFGTVLLIALGSVIISFLFLYQKKKYRHRQEVVQMQENFNREMIQSKSEIQEQTLQHIATEVHDNFIPTLSVINLDLAGVLPSLAEPEKTVIFDSKALVKPLMTEMKSLSNKLNTDQVSRKGFANMLDEYLARLRKTGYCGINFTKEGDPYRLPPNKEIILFRMCQEALNNIIKHASAKNIDVRIIYKANVFIVWIKDDGVGFDTESNVGVSRKADSTGLYNMNNRSLAIDAELVIESQPGEGTSITISLPII